MADKRHTYYQGATKKQATYKGSFGVKSVLFFMAIALAISLRTADGGALFEIRQKLFTMLRTDADYKAAVTVFGKAVSGNSEERRDAVAVLGREVLGLGGSDAQSVSSNIKTDSTVTGEISPVTY